MKNKLFIASLALLAAGGLTSCVTDTEPRLNKPTEFKLNTPAFAEQLYVFDCDDEGNSLNDITFTVSQPNYGVACMPNYTVQVARDEADFAKWDQQQAENGNKDEEGTKADGEEGLPLTVMVDIATTTASITIPGETFCNAVNELYDLNINNVKDSAHPVAVRVHAEVENAPNSAIWSNPVTVNVLSYVRPVPDKIWIVGACNDWAIATSTMALVETEIGSRVYEGDYKIDAGKFILRFYDELGDWDTLSIGSQFADNALDVIDASGAPVSTLTEEGVTMPCVQSEKGNPAKGSWQIQNWTGGKVHFVVDLNTNQVTFSLAPAAKIYIIGACQGWAIDSDKMYLSETEEGSKVYQGKWNIDAGSFMLRFYSELGDWDNNSIGSQEPDNPVEISVPASGESFDVVVGGKGSWSDPSWAGGECQITLDLNINRVTFIKL